MTTECLLAGRIRLRELREVLLPTEHMGELSAATGRHSMNGCCNRSYFPARNRFR